LYPPGAFGGAFPQGVLQSFNLKEDRFRGETTAEYTASVSNKWLFGVGGFHNSFRVLSDDRNYVVRTGRVIPTGQFAPFGGVNDASILDDTTQTVYYFLAQDEWRLVRD